MKKLQTGLRQKARQMQIDDEKVEVVCEQMIKLCQISPMSKQMKYRVGIALLCGAKIVAPACPDYSHDNGCYTFRSVGGGVSLLTNLHIEFLHQVQTIVPNCQITILLADHEAKDQALCEAIGLSQEEFSALISESVENTKKKVFPFGWQVMAMTKMIEDLEKQERENIKLIRNNKGYSARITTDTIARIDMYRQINHNFSIEEMTERTIKTAAQYLAMGQFVAKHNLIVCNHSTVNLCWYKESGAAVLHNPVSVY